LDWASEAAQWILLIGGFAIFWVLVAPELDARFGQWWFIPMIVVSSRSGTTFSGVNYTI
jgi:hypothetical protein